ncbi:MULTISPECIES: ECF transporter S component [Enterococcus]|uniref:ECF transporter S component n=1 Tax=Enterococcus thailandicus TaxID=417368 RepID=A0A179ETX9_ENTTH|nr:MULTISPECIES: ECF transporter S component [Enterococcus]ASZ06853.1 ECF transporter S component [Enterococcus thailandicus]MDA3964297.1 ECF transporter S component [Enterococcus thailandicus]MDA3972943.1 ECF transporter S component [Enterococcus thailandicus]MDA3975623.1 ECF transporter S component [Enterococcus thailandicus]MDA3980403.1 ECF transporter S component [Enterococcus thailandicus]
MKNTKNFTLTAMFLAILILLAVTPLGFIPIGPINATTMHIPVIIASIVLGPRLGAFLGGVFGFISLIRSTIIQTPLSFVFSPLVPVIGTTQGSWKALLVVFIPRILIGIVPYFVYMGFKRFSKRNTSPVALFIAGLAGSLTNTILVMNLIYFLFQQDYAQVIGANTNAVYSAILAVIFTSGVPEAIVAGLATAGVASVLLKLVKTNPTQEL